jgi:2-keto-4-pentenoate hydratase/2-oxohepta-3-ene-1,7-dioic acid hydratase in catechol pathway
MLRLRSDDDILTHHANLVSGVRFVRFGPAGAERPGVLVDDATALDISSMVDDLGPATLERLSSLTGLIARAPELPRVDLAGVRLGSPVARPHKIIGVGLNYADHATESGADIPSEPIIFLKASSSLSGPNDDVLIHSGFTKVDWEVELALVIGATARFLDDENAARAVIAGYAIGNDISERSLQLERGGQWVKGKSADTFAPLGPWLVTPDEISDVSDLPLRCRVNGELRQDGSTADMIFGPSYLVWYLSQCMTLEPGDVVFTGTPLGIGMSTGTYLSPGDVVECEIPGLGMQRQRCHAT